MKVKSQIISLLLIVSFYPASRTDANVDHLFFTIGSERSKQLTFWKYYESYEPNGEPNSPGYRLPLSLTKIINYDQVNSLLNLTNVGHLIEQNGFAVIEHDFGPGWNRYRDDILMPYAYLQNTYDDIPFFVTTDTALFLYHLLFDETLKDIEESTFIQDINDLTRSLLNDALQNYEQLEGDLKEANKRNIAYLSVAQQLIDPNAFIPELVDEVVLSELIKIEAHCESKPSEIFIYKEDYSQYVPRGHYTRSEQLKRYFRAMMWYGRMAFLLKGGPEDLIGEYDARIQTLQAFLLATSLKNIQVGDRTGLDIWDRLYTVTAFYVGLADDLTPYDYLWALDQVFEAGFILNNLADAHNLFALKTKLSLLPTPEIYGGTGNIVLTGPITDESLNEILDKTKGMRLMGQRFVPDSYMFQHLVFPEVGGYLGNGHPFTLGKDSNRAYVRGLDVMALMGSQEALKILIEEGDTDYFRFWQRFGELKDEYDTLSHAYWNINLYWSWLYTLKALLDELPEGYPNFMYTETWQRHQLHTALASWTQLRHDTILYAKQSGTPGGELLLLETPPGYVEPILDFWGRLLSLTRMTSRGIDDLNVLTPEAHARFTKLEELLQRILDIVSKQLADKQLSPEDCEFIIKLPYTFERIVTELGAEDLKVTIVADVHTNLAEEKTVEEAIGRVDLIIVACPMPNNMAFLAVGPVFSYYEFKHPTDNRLTDEAWRELLDSPKKPDRPQWYRSLMGTR